MSNPHSKTPGGQAASDKFMKQQAASHGEGTAPEAPGGNSGKAPGEAPVASDSGRTNVGIDNNATNVPGQKGLEGVSVRTSGSAGDNINQGNMK